MTRHRKLAAIFAAVLTGLLTVAALAMSPKPVSWGYQALDDLCLLQAVAAVDGVDGAYPIGSTVVTKFGKWTCVKVVAQQSPVVSAGVWVQN